MTIRFTKMHGLGNDFIIIDAVNQSINLSPSQIKDLARRDTGIGFDQCLLVETTRESTIDFFYRIFNADGQEVGQCGNGARCLARFVYHYGLTTKKIMTVATCTTKMQLQINEDNTVTVDMGKPKFNPKEIPLKADHPAVFYRLPLNDGSTCKIHALSLGNPHAVTVVDHLSKAPLTRLGKQISQHPFFPEQTNAGFMEIIDASHIRLRVYERGCGETRACGSGAVAAAAVGRLWYHMNDQIKVSLQGGELYIDWSNSQSSIYLTGPASFVYEGILMSF
jgi:diaminopimelate epimerase